MEEEIHRNWIRKEERDTEPDLIKIFGVHEKEFHLKYKNHKVKAEDYTRYEVSPPKTKLRGYLESFNTETGDDGEDVIKVKNPWAEHTSPFFLRKHDDVIDQSKTLDFYAPDWRTTLDRKSPPSEKWMMPFQEKEAIAGPTKAERRFDANVRNLDPDSSLDNSYGAGTLLNGYISGSGTSSDIPVKKAVKSKGNLEDHSADAITGFKGSTLKAILTPPQPQSYRGGRRSTSGKPPQPRKYVCDVCGKAFSRSNTLVTHKRIHTGDKPFACELCGRAFRQPGNLTRHRLTHTTVKPYVCSQCGKAFNRASNLHTHMRTHTNYKPFVCQFCGKGFHQKIDMKIHSYTHTGEKPHKCKKCGRGFKQLTHLTYHMRTHSEVSTRREIYRHIFSSHR
ncbi:putative Krueppel-related zinc finger protein 1 isoform X1 [Apostichopus japonicus]|uniref:Putative Krueppel-related zinc finger protein 1 isoform X1 n=1 Tax=Stichopus japonicus TaxID=307972 RepID=A0A2G8KBE6_STIJA|nr:putative Krueppel-related zinc finger protein 1 isoform X1 [Apostichopus japonicus]